MHLFINIVGGWSPAIIVVLSLAGAIGFLHATALFVDVLSLVLRHFRQELDANTDALEEMSNEMRLLSKSVFRFLRRLALQHQSRRRQGNLVTPMPRRPRKRPV